MAIFVENYYIILILVLLNMSILIFLRSIIGIIVQLAFFGIVFLLSLMNVEIIMTAMLLIQIILVLSVLYRFKKAVDRNYQLVLEKTHAVERSFTKNDYTGDQKNFLFK